MAVRTKVGVVVLFPQQDELYYMLVSFHSSYGVPIMQVKASS